ncbi:D-aminoacyl-tRNA deacylase [Nakamurella deserti]|uniref:D-aminoacyl-tRNA deacylase n=1 Tax=Nakamurella deserti TaxID=2164074 RepID=UPI000DBEA4F4|nr:D-aminoacyl-tRNA deacylase [Nakamurella deserti]
MRAVVTRVVSASVAVDGAVVGELPGPGLLVLLGVTHTDDAATAVRMASRIAGLRILRAPDDPDGARGEVGAVDIGAPVLVVSQFTLYGDTRKGRRPSWSAAAPGDVAEPLVKALVEALRAAGLTVATGVFGAMMAVTSVNDGPFTLVLDV